ncbi:MAG: hypothetical protein Q9162_004264 [Coniocarpon cinnabarinum]
MAVSLMPRFLPFITIGLLFQICQTIAANLQTHGDTFQPDVVLRISSIQAEIACVERPSVVVNGTTPGPAVSLPAGKTTWVRVYNDMSDQNATVHWHGLTQSVAPFSDGTPLASQWPIPPEHFFDYELHPTDDEAGSYFYHSHVEFQTVSAIGPLIVTEASGPPPIQYDDERYLMLSELYQKNDSAIVNGLLGAPFVWSGEPNTVLVNGHSPPVVNATSDTCAPEVIEVEPDKTYRLRVIGGVAMADWSFAFENHTDLQIVGADGRYTKPVDVQWIQASSGQRFEVLLHTKSVEELASDCEGQTDFWIQLEDRYRPTVVTGYALLRYVNTSLTCATPACYQPGTSRTSLPSVPSPIPNITAMIPPVSDNVTNTWLEYALTPLNESSNADFPTADQVTRRLYLSNVQTFFPDGQTPFMVNNHTWLAEPRNSSYNSTPDNAPYLVDIYKNGATAVPTIAEADAYAAANPMNSGASPFDNSSTDALYTGYAPDANAYPANVGEVIEIVLLNEAGYAHTYDVHPWHAHGGHYYDLGSGSGMYDPDANEAHLASLKASTGFVPALRDTTLLYRFPADNKVSNPEGTVSGWRAWRIRVTDPGVWMIHCHTLQHMVMGMQTVWVMGDAAQITHADVSEEAGYEAFGGDVEYEPPSGDGGEGTKMVRREDEKRGMEDKRGVEEMSGYLEFGGQAYGNNDRAPVVNHYFDK